MSVEPKRAEDVIRASEIGEYVHCQRAWWLGRVQGVENENRAWMDAGTERHREHGQQMRRAGLMQQAAWVLVGVAVIGVVLLLLRLAGLI